jgi:predicted NUDIX family phosphoesterase
MKTEYILAVDQALLTKHPVITESNVSVLNDAVQVIEGHGLTIRRRHELEADPSFKQIIPYTLYSTPSEEGMKYLAYRRTKVVGEQRLAGKCSVGFGGHIDIADIVIRENNTIDLNETLQDASVRELEEELDTGDHVITVDDIHGPLFIIYDGSDEVGQVHLGLVMSVTCHAGENDVKANEPDLEIVGWHTARELLDMHYNVDINFSLENWSLMLLEKICELEADPVKV